MQQQTLINNYTFEGKGLHTGKISKMTLRPAPENTGIVFVRTDLGVQIEAVAENVTSTARSTTISKSGASVSTIEHLMSALTGLGVDNAIVEIDNEEVPILDGSAKFYLDAIVPDGLNLQNAEKTYVEIKEKIELKDEKTGSWVKIEPAENTSYDLTVDFNSKVLGVQTAHYDENTDYAFEIGKCRTFVFFHEIEFLFNNNLIKGGDVDNAIVIVEHPVTKEQVDNVAAHIGKTGIEVNESSYLNNLTLHFPNECGRHKLLDLIGDLRLSGGFLKGKITAFKPGHTINSEIAKLIRKTVNK